MNQWRAPIPQMPEGSDRRSQPHHRAGLIPTAAPGKPGDRHALVPLFMLSGWDAFSWPASLTRLTAPLLALITARFAFQRMFSHHESRLSTRLKALAGAA